MKESRKPVRKPRTPAVSKPADGPVPVTSKKTVRKKAVVPAPARPSAADDLEQSVRVAAYFRAERRGFMPGQEIDDWLAAELEMGTITTSRRRRVVDQGRGT